MIWQQDPDNASMRTAVVAGCLRLAVFEAKAARCWLWSVWRPLATEIPEDHGEAKTEYQARRLAIARAAYVLRMGWKEMRGG